MNCPVSSAMWWHAESCRWPHSEPRGGTCMLVGGRMGGASGALALLVAKLDLLLQGLLYLAKVLWLRQLAQAVRMEASFR